MFSGRAGPLGGSLTDETPSRHGVSTGDVGMNQPRSIMNVRRHMDTVLAGILAVPLDLAVEVGNRERSASFRAVAFDPRDDVVGSGVEMGPRQMASNSNYIQDAHGTAP